MNAPYGLRYSLTKRIKKGILMIQRMMIAIGLLITTTFTPFVSAATPKFKVTLNGPNVVITASSKIIDVTGAEPVEYSGYVPERSVVIPGSFTKQFPAGEFQVPCALIIGQRKESTDKKVSLNAALRENNVSI